MPNTEVAVSVKPCRIWFMPKFITEPMPFIIIEGMPTVRICRTIFPLSLAYRRPNCTSGLNFSLKYSASIAATHCPMTVAQAAPAMPMAGRPNLPWIRMGSRIMLMMAPVDWVIMVCTVRPVACSSRSPRISMKMPSVIRQQIRE